MDFGQILGGIMPQNPEAAPVRPQGLSKGQLIAGILADALQGAMGRQGSFAPMMERRRQEQTDFERGEQQYQRRRADQRDDALWAEQHRAPYRFEGNNGDVFEVGPDQMVRKIFSDPSPKMNFIPDGMGGGQWVAVPTAQTSQSPLKPVGKLTPIDGGPTPTASGGFPR